MDHTIYFVRHGETEWNFDGRLQGQLDSPLTEKGRSQADRSGQILAREIADASGFDVVASPLGRTLETARLALRHIGATPKPEKRLAEIDLGQWSGLTFEEVEVAHPELQATLSKPLWEFVSPGGESLEHATDRARSWLLSIGKPTIAVSHGLIGRIIRGIYLKLPLDQAMHLAERQGVVIRLQGGQEHELTLD